MNCYFLGLIHIETSIHWQIIIPLRFHSKKNTLLLRRLDIFNSYDQASDILTGFFSFH